MCIYILMKKLLCSICAEISLFLNQNIGCGNFYIEPFQWTVFRSPKIGVKMMDKKKIIVLCSMFFLPMGPECYTLKKKMLKALILRENGHTTKSMQSIQHGES